MGKILGLLFVLVLAAVCVACVQPVTSQAASRKIVIMPDGSVVDSNPVTPILQDGNVYTFTGDVHGRLDVQRSNVVVDGAGYALIKSELDFGVIVGTSGNHPEWIGVDGITIINLRVIGFNYGITLGGKGNTIQNVNITGSSNYNDVAIWVSGSNHVIRDCRITGNAGYGMLIHATGVVVSGNYIVDNGHFGIYFYDRAVTLRNNVLNNNLGPFMMDEMSLHNPGEPFQISSSDIDSSNTVDGKPVYYWVNEHDKTVPSDAGYVVLDNCTNITVKGLSINRNSSGRFYYGASGISLIRTGKSTVSGNVLNGTGIYISYSSQDILVANNNLTCSGINLHGYNMSIVENFISGSRDSGIALGGSATALVAKNNLTACATGINLESAAQKRVLQNSIVDCDVGIHLFSSNDNVFQQNSFIDNKQQVAETHYSTQWPPETYYQSVNNSWDSNFWSDYNGTDANGDGFGDTPYIVYENNTDNYPLMTQFAPAFVQPSPSPAPSQSPSPSPSSSPLLSPSPSPSTPTPNQQSEPEPFPTVPVAAASVAAVVLVSTGLLVYFKKHKNIKRIAVV